MAQKFHGVFSLIVASLAILISAIFIFKNSLVFGITFIAFCAISALAILRLFCAKCPSRDNCGHVLPGLVLKKLFRNVKLAPYSFLEIALLGICAGIVVIVPQYWVFKNMLLFIIYWAMMIFAGIDIKFAVCTTCENGYCPSNKRFKGFFREYNR
jgi:hypothetical protein